MTRRPIDESSLFREPGVHGAILTEALASRFKVHIQVPTDWDLARHLGVPRAAVDAAIALNQQLTCAARKPGFGFAACDDSLINPLKIFLRWTRCGEVNNRSGRCVRSVG